MRNDLKGGINDMSLRSDDLKKFKVNNDYYR